MSGKPNGGSRARELPRAPNFIGTPEARRPPGSILAADTRPPAAGGYEAWTPED